MTKKQSFLREACEHLELKIEFNIKLTAPSGESVVADAAVSQAEINCKVYIFGITPPAAITKLIDDEGSGCSAFGDPTEQEVFDLDSYTEMFIEWGFVIYPTGIDCVWLASDRDGCVGAFVTGGEGPIPVLALQSVHFDVDQIESEILTLPKTPSSLTSKASNEYKSFIEIAERGIFVYDWRDLHRAYVECTNAYEVVAVPATPLKSDSLPSALNFEASKTQFGNVSFREAGKLDVMSLVPCLRRE